MSEASPENRMNDQFDFGIHVTDPYQIEEIQKVGLRVNSAAEGMTREEGKWANDVYGMTPVFVSFDKPWLEEGIAVFVVDVRGYPKVADLASLVDHGAYVSDDEDGFRWKEEEEPTELADFLDEDGFIAFADLLIPDSPVVYAAMNVTHSAAILASIPPDKVELVAVYGI